MELFVDSVGKQFNLAIINNKKVLTFKSIKTDKNTANNGVYWIKEFLEKNQINLSDIKGYYFTIGPGSFTGTKVALNIIQTFELVNPTNNFYIINNFNLLKTKKQKVAIEIGRNKFLVRKWFFYFHYDIILLLSKIDKSQTIIGYEKFTKKSLQTKIDTRSFKACNDLKNIKLQYGNKFI